MKSLPVNFYADPGSYKHWRLELKAPIATLTLDVDPGGGLRGGYDLKLNSYDLSVDIELYDAVQRLRFEHPEIKSVVITSALDKVFCAGANIQMLATSTHHHKVNFCKFTNETRSSIEDATSNSGQTWIAAVNGTAAGGGYELALACDEIILVDDRASTVSLPEIALLAVLPGTGGLTRLVDKRHVRRDLADVFATKAEGVKGAQATKWGLVDDLAPKSRFSDRVNDCALRRSMDSDRPTGVEGIVMQPLECGQSENGFSYRYLKVDYNRDLGAVTLEVEVPDVFPTDMVEIKSQGSSFWYLQLCREIDDAVLRLRFNEPELGTWVFRTRGNAEAVLAADEFVRNHSSDWLMREIHHYWKRTLNRIELSARSIVSLVTPGSCFVGTLVELILISDRSFMFDGIRTDQPSLDTPHIVVTESNNGWYPMINGLARIESRFYGRSEELVDVRNSFDKELNAEQCEELGLVTYVFDEIDFDDEVRIFLEERNSFSPDSLTGLEANCRFVGPETMESKIFARLSAWQNWIFQRENAVGPEGALASYGSGSRPNFNRERI